MLKRNWAPKVTASPIVYASSGPFAPSELHRYACAIGDGECTSVKGRPMPAEQPARSTQCTNCVCLSPKFQKNAFGQARTSTVNVSVMTWHSRCVDGEPLAS